MPFDPDPAVRSAMASRARNLALAGMSAEQRRQGTEAARAAQRREYEDQVDPHRELDEAERDQRVQFLINARMAELGAKSAKARRERKAERSRREVDNALDALAAAEQTGGAA